MPTTEPSSRIASESPTAQIHVTSRHVLVAQALTAALQQREHDATLLLWERRDEVTTLGSGDVLVVLDDLPHLASVHGVREVIDASAARSIVLTNRPAGAMWGALLSAGAAEILRADSSLEDVDSLISTVSSGQDVMSREERVELEAAWAVWISEDEDLLERVASLTPRERTVLDLLSVGKRVADIGVALGVTEATVRSQVKSMRAKLGAQSQLGAVAMAHRFSGKILDRTPLVPSPRCGD